MAHLPQGASISTRLNESFSIQGISIRKLDVVTVVVTVVLLAALGLFLEPDTSGRPDAGRRRRLPHGTHARREGQHGHRRRVRDQRAPRRSGAPFSSSPKRAPSPRPWAQRRSLRLRRHRPRRHGHLSGAVLGGYIVGGITVALQAYLPLELRPYRDAFVFTAVFVLLLPRPQGLVVARTAVRRV